MKSTDRQSGFLLGFLGWMRPLGTVLEQMPLSAALGLAILSCYILMAALAPWIAPFGMVEIVGGAWEEPSSQYWLGTDNLGRDLLSRMIWGARITLFVASVAALLAFALGVILGFVAATFGGWLDQLLSRLIDLLLAIPTLIFALVVLSVLPNSIPVLITVMAVLEATRVFRVSRAVAVDIEVMDYVEAAWLRGENWLYVIFREMLPNAVTPLLAELGVRFVYTVLFLSALSFLGLGIQPPVADWGGMVRENKDGILFGVSAALIPGAAIATLAISVNFVVDWLLNRTSRLYRMRRDG